MMSDIIFLVVISLLIYFILKPTISKFNITNKQANKQANKQVNKQANKQVNKQINRQENNVDKQTNSRMLIQASAKSFPLIRSPPPRRISSNLKQVINTPQDERVGTVPANTFSSLELVMNGIPTQLLTN